MHRKGSDQTIAHCCYPALPSSLLSPDYLSCHDNNMMFVEISQDIVSSFSAAFCVDLEYRLLFSGHQRAYLQWEMALL